MVELKYNILADDNGDLGLMMNISHDDTSSRDYVDVMLEIFLNQNELGELLDYILKEFENRGINI